MARSVAEHPSDEQVLLAQIVDRNAEAFAALFEAASPAVFFSALRLSRSQSSAKEIVREVFLDRWSRPQRYQGDGSLRLRLASRAHHTGVAWLQAGNGAAGVSESETAVDDLQDAEAISLTLAALPDQQGVPIRLASFGGRSYRQIAEELHVPESVVSVRMRTGLRRLGDAIRSDVGRSILEAEPS